MKRILMCFFAMVLSLPSVLAQEDGGQTLWHYDKSKGEWVRVLPLSGAGVNVITFGKGKASDGSSVKTAKPAASRFKAVKPSGRAESREKTSATSTGAVFSIHTNALYDCLLAPSLGVEAAIARDWSAGADTWLAWLHNKEHDVWWENYGLDLYGRYWFGDGHDARDFRGWHAGIYAGTLTYDVWHDGKGYQSPDMFKTFRTGGELGWSGAIAKDWRVDIYYGLGWFHTDQKVYDHNFGGGYYVTRNRTKDLLDYSRFGVTICYIIR